MAFLKCKDCIVRACCTAVCQDFKDYCSEEYNISIGNDMSLEQCRGALGELQKNHIPHILTEDQKEAWRLSKIDTDKLLLELKP